MPTESVLCKHCHQPITIKKPKWRSQIIAGHEKNCNQNPNSRWAMAKRSKDSTPTTPETTNPPKDTASPPPPEEKVEPSTLTTPALDMDSLASFAKELGSQPTAIPGVPQPTLEQPLPSDYIPPEVLAEFVLVVVSVNMDLCISYAKKKNLHAPEKVEMSSATSKWLGRMISQELGPQKSSWGLIIAALSPYVVVPWLSVLMQSDKGMFAGIFGKLLGGGKAQEAET